MIAATSALLPQCQPAGAPYTYTAAAAAAAAAAESTDSSDEELVE